MRDTITIPIKEYELLKEITAKAQQLDLAVTLQAKSKGINSLTFAVEEAHNNITGLLSEYRNLAK